MRASGRNQVSGKCTELSRNRRRVTRWDSLRLRRDPARTSQREVPTLAVLRTVFCSPSMMRQEGDNSGAKQNPQHQEKDLHPALGIVARSCAGVAVDNHLKIATAVVVG